MAEYAAAKGVPMKTGTERMIAKKDGPIGWMPFNDTSRHNAVSIDMWRSVPEILAEFERDDEVRTVVLRGVVLRSAPNGISSPHKPRSMRVSHQWTMPRVGTRFFRSARRHFPDAKLGHDDRRAE